MKDVADPAIKQDRVYTYGDYRKWPDDERWELIEGTAWNMSPAPMRLHQGISGELFIQIRNHIEDKGCKGCTGAPDWIVEILSPNTSKKDFNNKLSLYEKHGVREYWIVDPGNKYVHLLNDDNRYPEAPGIYLKNVVVPCTVLEGLKIDLSGIFLST